MESTENKMIRFAERVSKEKLQLFTKLLKQNLVNSGVDSDLFDDAAQATTLAIQVQDTQDNIISQALRRDENRGIDTIGRILVEFCFIRTSTGKMIWPEYSQEDTLARRHFSDAVLPRPLMRYFLVSIRGSVEEIDGFSSDSFLFDTDEEIDAARQPISDFIDDFKGPFGSGESSVDWQAVYEDKRFQKAALDIVSGMRNRIHDRGLDGYLARLESYRQLDTTSSSHNIMQRPLTREDVHQIDMALMGAEDTLREMTH